MTLKRDHLGRPIFIAMPRRVERMELACTDLYKSLGGLSVDQLKTLQPTGPFVPLVDNLIAVRELMD